VKRDAGDEVNEFAEHDFVERRPVIVLRQDGLQRRVCSLNGEHRIVDELADGRLLRACLQVRPARFLPHPEHIVGEVFVRVLRRSGIFLEQRGALGLKALGNMP
jgi:hypothetical protein